MYEWKAWDERSICAFYLGKTPEDFNISCLLLESRRNKIPPHQLHRLQMNKAFGAGRILLDNKLESYNETFVSRLDALMNQNKKKKKAEYYV